MRSYSKSFLHTLYLLLLLTFSIGCSPNNDRIPVPESKINMAQIPSIPHARFWGDKPLPEEHILADSPEEIEALYPDLFNKSHEYLTISGGGPNGAFGAGLIVGWTASGNRPEFEIVTGVSTGALIAPLAFLGSSYDEMLREIYTTISQKDISKKRGLTALIFGDSMASSKPLKKLIRKYINRTVLEELSAQYSKGRRLYIVTTNLDAERPVIWDVTAIAASNSPKALDLICDVLLASASVPVVMPPVYIEVEADSKRYFELHVDGGASAQVFFYPAFLEWGEKILKELILKGNPKIYVILNSRLLPTYETIESRLMPIAERSIRSLIRNQAQSELYRIYYNSKRDGIDYNLAYIPEDFNAGVKEQFAPKYMKKLFQLGYSMGSSGSFWEKHPPGF